MRLIPKRRAVAPKIERRAFGGRALVERLHDRARQFGRRRAPAQNRQSLADGFVGGITGDARERGIHIGNEVLVVARFGQSNAHAGGFDGHRQTRVLQRDFAQRALVFFADDGVAQGAFEQSAAQLVFDQIIGRARAYRLRIHTRIILPAQ